MTAVATDTELKARHRAMLVGARPPLGGHGPEPALEQKIVDGVREEASDRSIDELAAARDAMLLELVATRAKHERSGGQGGMRIPTGTPRGSSGVPWPI